MQCLRVTTAVPPGGTSAWNSECGLHAYLQLGKELLKQDILTADLNVPKGAKYPLFVVILFCYVLLCVVSERKYCQGQNNLSPKRGSQAFLCLLWGIFSLSHYFPLLAVKGTLT